MYAKRVFLLAAIFLVAYPALCGALTVLAVKSKDLAPYDQVIAGFRSELRDESLNLVVIDDVQKDTDIAARVVSVKPDLIVCLGSEALECACPLGGILKFFCMVTSSRAAELAGKAGAYGVTIDLPCSTQFEMLLKAFPDFKRIGVLYDPQINGGLVAEARADAAKMGLQLVALPVRSIKDVPSALLDLDGKIDALWSIFDPTAYGPETMKYVLLHTIRKNIPFIGFSAQQAKAGAIMAIHGDYEDMGRQLAVAVQKITRGERLPENVMQPRKVRVAVNRKVAEAMGIAFSPAFLQTVGQFY